MNKQPLLPLMQKISAGFSLGEMLLAMLLSSLIFLAAGQFFPQLFQQSRRLQQQQQLAQEIDQLMLIFEKACVGQGTANRHLAGCLRSQ